MVMQGSTIGTARTLGSDDVKLVPDSLYNLYRRYFGRYTLDDPRPIAEGAPYTFYLPSTEEIAAVGPGDLVKLLFEEFQTASNSAWRECGS